MGKTVFDAGMKTTLLTLVTVTLVLTLINLLANFGLIGGSSAKGGDYEYLVMNATGMDSVGFTAVAKEEGIEPGEDGQMSLPGEKLIKQNLLAKTLEEVEKEGWEFVSVTSDNYYVFRK